MSAGSVGHLLRMSAVGARMGALAATLAAGMAVALASSPGEDPPAADDVLHRVAPGDTLYDIARRHLQDPSRWPLLQRVNAIPNPHHLRPGEELRIPARLRAAEPVPARVDFVHGSVRAWLPDTDVTAPALTTGMMLLEGSRVQADAGGFISLRLADGSIVQVLAGSRVALDRMRRRPGAQNVQSVIRLEQGRVESSVVPQEAEAGLFEVRTPLVVAGVRGTRFGVSATAAGAAAGDVADGAVAFRVPGGAGSVLVQAGQGIAVTAPGRLGDAVDLLPAPDLAAVPAVAGDADTLALAWEPLPGAQAYDVRVGADETLAQVVRNARFDTASARFEALADGDYVLAVRAVDAHGIPGEPARRALRVKAHPVPPLFRTPAPDAEVDSPAVTLRCTEVLGARGYHLQLATDADFTALVVDAPGLPMCELRVPELPPGGYHWRAAAQAPNVQGLLERGPFSGARRFHVVQLPAPATLTSVAAGADRLDLHWPDTPGERQRVQVARDAAFTQLSYDDTPARSALTLDTLAPGRYFVRLQAIDARGRAGAFSSPRVVDVGRMLRTLDDVPVQDGAGGPVSLP